jgi:hypothetical protein
MIKNMLVEAGISASLNNQLMGSIAPWQVSGGDAQPVEIVILEKDKEKALSLIKEYRGIE